MIKNILVTGAGGFLGGRLTERLASMPGYRIVATGRRVETGRRHIGSQVKFITGDLIHKEFTEQLVKQDIDVLIHCAALSSLWGSYDDFYQANVVATENLLTGAKQAAIKRIIHISTPSIYFDYNDRFDIREEDPLPVRSVNHYAGTKLLAEQRVKASGIEHIILRPRAIIGAGDTVIMPRLIRARRENRLRIIGNGKNIVDITSVSNLIDAILLSIEASEPAINQVYNITNSQPVQLWPFINDVLSKINLPLGLERLPYPVLYAIAALSEQMATIAQNGREPAITRYGAGILAKSCTLNIDKAKKLLGYVPRQTVEEGINEFVNWYLTLNPCL
ncbi:NAD-dependent epimerase/dehydratase family protein [Runella sp.]|jgi:2-alkyl-3-oxoalkanoate reductase|uniref:NAD-dependent epimerase/dehydratase family protein n=1 Tax=Runella sp. TaxID=1960881 RepID=UPI00262831F7|nr:NAD-dependent epimerase/dehydratase family protein [Runella sp.]